MTSSPPRKQFTVDEANQTLPLVKAIVSDIVQQAAHLADRNDRLARIRTLRGEPEKDDPYHEEVVEIEEQLKKNAATLQAGIRFAEMQFDNVFGGLTVENGLCRARIRDVRNGRVVELSFDETFRECIVYNPPHRQAVCIEPYTCVPDCFRLQTQGIDAGARVLAPGESLTASVTIGIH